MIKVKVKANMSSVLDKEWVECLMPLEYKYLHHVLLNLGNKASSIKYHCKHNSIIKSVNWVPLVPRYGTSPYQNDKTNKQNEQSQHPFYLPFGIVFYCKVYHRRFTIVCK